MYRYGRRIVSDEKSLIEGVKLIWAVTNSDPVTGTANYVKVVLKKTDRGLSQKFDQMQIDYVAHLERANMTNTQVCTVVSGTSGYWEVNFFSGFCPAGMHGTDFFFPYIILKS